MGYSAKAVANYFLDLADKEGKEITPLQIQKLVYISYGWYLAIADEQLIDDEYIEAWDYGPVFPSLYLEFKNFGSDPITGRAEDFDVSDDYEIKGIIVPSIPKEDIVTRTFLDKIWEVYGGYDGGQLVSLTHADGSPWDQIRKKEEKMRNPRIPNKIIKEYYEKRLD